MWALERLSAMNVWGR